MRKNDRAVTLIELAMVIVIVGVLAGVSSMYIRETINLWRFLTFRSEVVAQGRLALIRMDREIRQVKDKNSISTASATQFQFTDISDNSINFYLSGNNLMRKLNALNPDVLASDVTVLNFKYYGRDNSELARPVADTTQIYRIGIELTVESGGQSNTLKSQVYPRNIF
jgi:prepilin-type N-terminal cleavage/methylation domain-containing protein